MTPSRAEVEDFLYAEAALLDEWKLEEWLALWTADARYVVPATDAPDGDPRTTLALIADDHAHLRARVQQLIAGTTFAEQPRSRTTRMISNVRVLDRSDDALRVGCNFVVHWFRNQRAEAFVGKAEYDLVSVEDRLRIRGKRIVLAHESLQSQGRISILL